MSDKDVFAGDDDAAKGGDDDNKGKSTQSGDGDKPTGLEQWVGEGKKYATAEDFVKAFGAGQDHIQTLEADNQKLRDASDQAKGVQDVLDAIQNANAGGDDKLTPEGVTEIATKAIQAHEATKTAEENKKTANETLFKLYGDKATDMVVKRSHELQMPIKAMEAMAKTSPTAFLALFPQAQAQSGNQGSGDGTPAKSSINTENLQANANQGELASYESFAAKRREMNKEKPGSGDKWYYSHKTQQQMLGAADGKEDQFFG